MSDNRPAVLLISPGIIRWVDMDFGLPHLVSLGSHLEATCGVRVEILDLNYESGSHQDLENTINELGPFILIGLSTYSSFDYKRTMTLASFLKDRWPKIPLVTGGYHASAVPNDLIFDGSPFDAVVQGEGERPMEKIVMSVLSGDKIDKMIWPIDLVDDINDLVPTNWHLLNRYWHRANDLGRKLQVYLSRGCSYHCTFCMERAKSGYKWRAFSADRAVYELEELSRFTDLKRWVVNIADPLFGFQRKWRRDVLNGILKKNIVPRQFWTLTRSDDLDEIDIELFAKAKFSIGIGLESGSPEMLKLMQKGNSPGNYLDSVLNLAKSSRLHGLNWATNVIVGHPGETYETMNETFDYLMELFHVGGDTCGWLSIDPFRLYPGSDVHQSISKWETNTGARFYAKEWWHRWYDNAFLAQYIDPSSSLNFKQRVGFMYEKYPKLVSSIHARFRGQDASIDRVFRQSLAEQKNILGRDTKKRILEMASSVPKVGISKTSPSVPIGINIKNPMIRLRENMVRKLLDRGLLRSGKLIEALLQVPPEKFMSKHDVKKMFQGVILPPPVEGLPNASLSLSLIVRGLEKLEPLEGEHMADCGAVTGYVTALMSILVGNQGRVTALHPNGKAIVLAEQLKDYSNVEVLDRPGLYSWLMDRKVDGIWLNGALPFAPRSFLGLLTDVGRVVCFLGPRFRKQDMVHLTPTSSGWKENKITSANVSPLSISEGWVRRPVKIGTTSVTIEKAPTGLRRSYAVLSLLKLDSDFANISQSDSGCYDWIRPLEIAYKNAKGRLILQSLPLAYPNLDDLLSRLDKPIKNLEDDDGKILCILFQQAIKDVKLRNIYEDSVDMDKIFADLLPLRSHLYGQCNRKEPPLVVYNLPELENSARAITIRGERRVALSLINSESHVRMQLLHEEIHPITDPMVLDGRDLNTRSTRHGEEGFGLHLELENTVIKVTEALLDKMRPDLLKDFEKWRGDFN